MPSGLSMGSVRTPSPLQTGMLSLTRGQEQLSFHPYPGGGSKAKQAQQNTENQGVCPPEENRWDSIPRSCPISLLEELFLFLFLLSLSLLFMAPLFSRYCFLKQTQVAQASLEFFMHLEELEPLVLLFLPPRHWCYSCSRCLVYAGLNPYEHH